MNKKQTPVQKEHSGACPTCGHCKCCEKKAAAPAPVYIPSICPRRHYPEWSPWSPTYPTIWYGSQSTTGSGLTIGGSTDNSMKGFTQ